MLDERGQSGSKQPCEVTRRPRWILPLTLGLAVGIAAFVQSTLKQSVGPAWRAALVGIVVFLIVLVARLFDRGRGSLWIAPGAYGAALGAATFAENAFIDAIGAPLRAVIFGVTVGLVFVVFRRLFGRVAGWL